MLNEILPTTPTAVKPEPIRVTCNRKVYWQSVERTCGHTDLIDIHDPRPGAYEFASNTEVACFECRKAAHQAQRAKTPPINHDRYTRTSGSAGGSTGGKSARRGHSGRRQQHPSRTRKIAEAAFLYNTAQDFLSEIASGQRRANATAIAIAKTARADALRTLRKLGAVAL